ncbi:MAG: hypothetical protein SVU32_03415, partial [Candidatus Nanohaloarchaea archaeon]|nr:hypothetical protein [Candidatus Nanohaloarchaea archaeon]
PGGLPSGIQEQIPSKNIPAGVHRPNVGGQGMNKTEALDQAQAKYNKGWNKLQKAKDQLDRNETQLAKQTLNGAIDNFDAAITLLQGYSGDKVQNLRQQARDGKAAARRAKQQISRHQQGGTQDGGDQPDGTNTTQGGSNTNY